MAARTVAGIATELTPACVRLCVRAKVDDAASHFSDAVSAFADDISEGMEFHSYVSGQNSQASVRSNQRMRLGNVCTRWFPPALGGCYRVIGSCSPVCVWLFVFTTEA